MVVVADVVADVDTVADVVITPLNVDADVYHPTVGRDFAAVVTTNCCHCSSCPAYLVTEHSQ